MTVIGTQDFSPDVLAVVVDADPTVTPVDAPRGSLVIFKPGAGDASYFVKDDDGSTTNVTPLGGGGGAWEAVSTATLGAPAATVTVTGFDATSRLWRLILSKVHPVTDNVNLAIELRIGGSFPAGANYQFHSNITPANQSTYAGINAVAATGGIILSGGSNQGNDAEFAARMQVLVPNPGATDERKTIQYSGTIWSPAATPVVAFVEGRGGFEALSTALDAVRFAYNSGNIAAGFIVDLYKLTPPT